MATHEITWDQRNENRPIEFDGGANEVCEGCKVELEQNGVRITAKIVEGTPGQSWTGEVTNVANADDDQLHLQIGATVRFEERHILRCAA